MQLPESGNLLKQTSKGIETKISGRRWIILLLFALFSSANAFQWMQYSIITNIVERYYNVSSEAVNWSSMVFMVTFPIFIIPVLYIIDYKGLRIAALIGVIGTFIAAVLKMFALRSELFYVVLLSQTIAALSQIFILPLPCKIAAIWFKPKEAALACSCGINGTQFGFALGFIIPTAMVQNHHNIDLIGTNLSQLCWGEVIVMIPITLAVIFWFDDTPPLPPAIVQAEERKKKPTTVKQFLDSLLEIIKTDGFGWHFIAYGMNFAVFVTLGTFLNQSVLYYFPNCEDDAGRMGLLIIICGMIGCSVSGIILDRSRRYKEASLLTYYMCLFVLAGFLGSLIYEMKILAYVTSSLFGVFMTFYQVAGFELVIEVTFPLEESTTTGILLAATQIFGIALSLVVGKLLERMGPVWALSTLLLALAIGVTATHLVPNVHKRQEAFSTRKIENKEEELKALA